MGTIPVIKCRCFRGHALMPNFSGGLLLLSKICKVHGTVPASYVLQQEHIHIKEICCHGRLADVSDGEYLGSPVAIKRLKVNKEGSDRVFKAPSANLACAIVAQLPPSGCVKRSSVGNTCPTRTSCPCWEYLCPEIHVVSAFSLSGWRTGM